MSPGFSQSKTGTLSQTAGLLPSNHGGGRWGNSWFRSSGLAQEGSSHCTQPLSGVKAVITANLNCPHASHVTETFAFPSAWSLGSIWHSSWALSFVSGAQFVSYGSQRLQTRRTVGLGFKFWKSRVAKLYTCTGCIQFQLLWAKEALMVTCFAKWISRSRLSQPRVCCWPLW